MADAIKSSLEREKRLESKDTGNSDKFEKYRKTHEKIRKWMDDLSKKYSIDNLAGHVTGIFAKYDKLKQNINLL